VSFEFVPERLELYRSATTIFAALLNAQPGILNSKADIKDLSLQAAKMALALADDVEMAFGERGLGVP
jgi:hypothetical protein